MSAPIPYLHFPGSAAAALRHYASIFGGELALHSFADFGRSDGRADLVAHGELTGVVTLFGADSVDEGAAIRTEGVMFALLGAADAETSRRWFKDLADGGAILDPLVQRPWGDWDGQVRDAHGVTWLIGFHGAGEGGA